MTDKELVANLHNLIDQCSGDAPMEDMPHAVQQLRSLMKKSESFATMYREHADKYNEAVSQVRASSQLMREYKEQFYEEAWREIHVQIVDQVCAAVRKEPSSDNIGKMRSDYLNMLRWAIERGERE